MAAEARFKLMIKKNDNVIVIAGKDKGKTGLVTEVVTKTGKVVVKDVNVATRHTKPTQKNPQGGTIRKEMPINASNVMYLDPKTNKPTRLGRKQVDGKWVRVAKKSGTVITT